MTSQELSVPTSDEFGSLEPDEIEERAEELAEEREMARLRTNKKFNYAMLRSLRPIANSQGLGAINLMGLFGYFDYQEKIIKFQNWQKVKEGKIQVRESTGRADLHGYVVVRPDDDQEHDIYIRVWQDLPNSVIIMPRRDEPLPRQGREKTEILEKMELVNTKRLDDYVVWIERMKKTE